MTRPTHVEFGYEILFIILALYGLQFSLFSIQFDGIVIILSWGIGVLLPDADHTKTDYGKRLRGAYIVSSILGVVVLVSCTLVFLIYRVFNWQFFLTGSFCALFVVFVSRLKHRGIMHSIWVPVLLISTALVGMYFKWFGDLQRSTVSMLFGLSGGYTTHLLADMFTNDGIRLFQPFIKNRIRFATISTGSIGEYAFRRVMRIILISITFAEVIIPRLIYFRW